MSDSSGIKATTTSGLTDLTLAVRIDGVPEQEVFLQHGLSIGRNPSNTICINEPDIERIHAMVTRQPDGTMLLECTETHSRLTLSDGSQVHSLELKPGAMFKLGKAVIRCLKRETRPTVVVAENPWDVRCPRCHEAIADLPHDAGHCPKCRLEIQYFQSHAGQAGTAGPETMAQPATDFQGWLPREVGPYRIRAFVAQGGMGIILRGLHKELDLPAAVKLLKVNSDDDSTWKARFLAEIDTLKTLRHPNVVHLQANGKDDKLLWLAMDWIDGDSLAKMASRYRSEAKSMPIEEIRATLLQVVAGLEYLHGRQIIHRDLKPSNVLMAHDALVKLVDFGIARSASGQTAVVTQLTHTGMVAGTESYMSPEQAEGQVVTPASDIYSLGVMWYEMVTGRRPVGAFLPPSSSRSDCPPAWSNAIAQCLQVSPHARPSLAAIAQALQAQGSLPPPLPGGRPPGAPHTGMMPARPPMQPQPPVHVQPVQHPAQTWQAPPVQQHPQGPGSGFQPAAQQSTAAAQAAQVAKAAGQTVASPAKTATAAVDSFLKQHPPDKALDKMGSVGAWIKSHKGPSVAIAGGVLLILLILIIRGCSSGPAPTPTNNTAGGGTAATGDKPAVQPPAVQTPRMTREQLEMQHNAGLGMVMQANSVNDQKFTGGMAMLTKAANEGYTPSMLALAQIYGNQNLPIYDRNKAVMWARKAQAAGDPNAGQLLQMLGE